jgi:aspartate/methionine/tyrosine aminotransferase
VRGAVALAPRAHKVEDVRLRVGEAWLGLGGHLIEKAGVAGMPMGGFYAEDQSEEEVAARRSLVRFAVCKSRAAVETAASRVRERYKL